MKRIILILYVIGCIVTDSNGQDVTINNLEEAIAIALENNVDLQTYLLNSEKAKIDLKNAKSYKMPVITGSFSGQRNIDLATTPLPAEIFGGEPGQTVDAQFGQAYNYNAGITIYKDFFNREAALQAKVAALNLEVENVSRQQFEELLKEQVSLHYHTVALAAKAVEISEKDLENARQVKQLTAEKYEEGLVDALVLNSAGINVNAVRHNLNANRQLILQSSTELKKLLGMTPEEDLIIAELTDDNMPDSYTMDLLSAPIAVESASLQLQQAEARLKINKSALLPSVSLNTYIGRQQFRNDFGLSFNSEAWSPYSYTALSLSVPIFSGFKNRRNISKGKLDHQLALNEQERVNRDTSLDDARLIADYQVSLDDVQSSKESFELYEENQKLTFQKFEAGVVSLDSYLNVFAEYLKAESAYLNNLSKMYSYYSQILPRIKS